MWQTKRIYIRPLNLNDTDALFEYWNQNRKYLTPFYPIRPEKFFSYSGQSQNILNEIDNWKQGLAYGFGIFLCEQDQLIGRVNLSNVVRGAWQNCTIGYSIAEHMQSQGYMTEAVTLAVKFAFEEANLHRVQAAVMPCNNGSIRVLEKVGFMYEGLAKNYLNIFGKWEDHKIFAITKEVWSA